jgi:PKD domain
VTISRSSPAESIGAAVSESAVGLFSTATLDIQRSTIDGYATPLRRGVLYGATAQLDASYSNFDLDDVDLDSEPGVTLGPGIISQPPQFVAPGFNPRAGSALIDSGGACLVDGFRDLGLGERCVDGDGLGGPQADIGAYEYQRAQPVADFVAGPAVTGSPVAFDAGSSSDPDPGDGSQLTYAWAFGDGQGGSGRTPSHIYAQPGDYEVTLMVVDPAGRPASVTRVVSVAAPHGDGQPPASRDSVAPVISGLRVSPKRVRIGTAMAKLSSRGGQIRFRLSEPARVTLRFASARTGRRRGSLRINGRAGANTVRFAGRLSRRRTLRPGLYRLAVLATDGAGNRAATKRTRFTLLPRR